MKNQNLLSEGDSLSAECRQQLASSGGWLCALDGETHTLSSICDKMAAGLVSALESNSSTLLPLAGFKKSESG